MTDDIHELQRIVSEQQREIETLKSIPDKKGIDDVLQIYLPDDYYEEIRHKLIQLVQRLIDSKISEQSQRIQELEPIVKAYWNRLKVLEMHSDNDWDAEAYRVEAKKIEALLTPSK